MQGLQFCLKEHCEWDALTARGRHSVVRGLWIASQIVPKRSRLHQYQISQFRRLLLDARIDRRCRQSEEHSVHGAVGRVGPALSHVSRDDRVNGHCRISELPKADRRRNRCASWLMRPCRMTLIQSRELTAAATTANYGTNAAALAEAGSRPPRRSPGEFAADEGALERQRIVVRNEVART
jgi:hypothetical protein